MHRSHRQVYAVIALALFAWTACGGKATGVDTSPSPSPSPSAGTSSGNPTTTDGGSPAGCPSSAPAAGDACAITGLECDYASDMPACGMFKCGDTGQWEGALSSINCPLPAGFTCPTPTAPELHGSSTPIDRTCTGDADCASVKFETDCCGDTFAFGVNVKSAAAATAAAAICQRSFPGCGCPSGPTVAETGNADAGFDDPIDPFCDVGTCKTRYR
jgi:hypothetical protein